MKRFRLTSCPAFVRDLFGLDQRPGLLLRFRPGSVGLAGILLVRCFVSGMESGLGCEGVFPLERLDALRVHVMSADSSQWVWERPAHVGWNVVPIFTHKIFGHVYLWPAAVDSSGNELPRECAPVWVFPS